MCFNKVLTLLCLYIFKTCYNFEIEKLIQKLVALPIFLYRIKKITVTNFVDF